MDDLRKGPFHAGNCGMEYWNGIATHTGASAFDVSYMSH